MERLPTSTSSSNPCAKDPRLSVDFIAPSPFDPRFKLAPLRNLPAKDIVVDEKRRSSAEASAQQRVPLSPSTTISTTSTASSPSSSFSSYAYGARSIIETQHTHHEDESPRPQKPIDHPLDHKDYYRSLSTEATMLLLRSRAPRAARPSYTERQKYYIMYARVVLDLSWPDIQKAFLEIFAKRRSKSGLCSVYYRTRKAWGMEEVLVKINEGEASTEEDRRVVLARGKDVIGERFW